MRGRCRQRAHLEPHAAATDVADFDAGVRNPELLENLARQYVERVGAIDIDGLHPHGWPLECETLEKAGNAATPRKDVVRGGAVLAPECPTHCRHRRDECATAGRALQRRAKSLGEQEQTSRLGSEPVCPRGDVHIVETRSRAEWHQVHEGRNRPAVTCYLLDQAIDVRFGIKRRVIGVPRRPIALPGDDCHPVPGRAQAIGETGADTASVVCKKDHMVAGKRGSRFGRRSHDGTWRQTHHAAGLCNGRRVRHWEVQWEAQ